MVRTEEYRQFASNRVAKIKERSDVQWHYVPTEENPADLRSRGGKCAGQRALVKWPRVVER